MTKIMSIGVDGVPDAEAKRCFDCYHCQGAISWWCTNKEAIKYRGTSLVGTKNCSFWKPIMTKNEFEYFNLREQDCIYVDLDLSENPKGEPPIPDEVVEFQKELKSKLPWWQRLF